jgi:hypothetical protein
MSEFSSKKASCSEFTMVNSMSVDTSYQLMCFVAVDGLIEIGAYPLAYTFSFAHINEGIG